CRYVVVLLVFFFFFQAEDGIRDWSVTGVQTCALPISPCPASDQGRRPGPANAGNTPPRGRGCWSASAACRAIRPARPGSRWPTEIGRASCRERVEISVVAGSLQYEEHEERVQGR